MRNLVLFLYVDRIGAYAIPVQHRSSKHGHGGRRSWHCCHSIKSSSCCEIALITKYQNLEFLIFTTQVVVWARNYQNYLGHSINNGLFPVRWLSLILSEHSCLIAYSADLFIFILIAESCHFNWNKSTLRPHIPKWMWFSKWKYSFFLHWLDLTIQSYNEYWRLPVPHSPVSMMMDLRTGIFSLVL